LTARMLSSGGGAFNWDRHRPCLEPDRSITGERVARRLEALRLQGQRPQVVRVDNGPEFTSKALDLWAHEHGGRLDFIRPGKPTDNCFIESFNGRFRDECLDAHMFTSLTEARKTIEVWQQDYNTLRPHSSLGGMSPEEYRSASKEENLKESSPDLSVVYREE
jgi:putative transposase